MANQGWAQLDTTGGEGATDESMEFGNGSLAKVNGEGLEQGGGSTRASRTDSMGEEGVELDEIPLDSVGSDDEGQRLAGHMGSLTMDKNELLTGDSLASPAPMSPSLTEAQPLYQRHRLSEKRGLSCLGNTCQWPSLLAMAAGALLFLGLVAFGSWALGLWTKVPSAEEIIVTGGAVAADDLLCSNIGTSIMKDHGGNAVDAAIATSLCLGVKRPFASGIGGGSYITVAMANGTRIFIDAREWAPAALSISTYSDDEEEAEAQIKEGPLASGIPGELAGLHYLYENFATLDWATLVAPALGHARDGFICDATLEARISGSWDIISRHDVLKNLLTNPATGEPYVEGDTVVWPQLATTLQVLSDMGVMDGFYHGPIGQALVQDMIDAGGVWSLDDLTEYEPRVYPAMETSYRGMHTVITGPVGGGPLVQFLLGFMERYQAEHRVTEWTPQHVHALNQAMMFAFAHRMRLGDDRLDEFNNTHVAELIEQLGDKEYIGKLRRRTTTQTHDPAWYGTLTEPLQDDGTSHFSAIDKDRNCVSMTSTVNWIFGSKVVSPSTGIFVNNQMDDFSLPNESGNGFGLPPSAPNYPYGRKRPLSSMAPTIVYKDGVPGVVIGGSGGPTIITATTQVLLPVLDFPSVSVGQAVAAPRFHNQLLPEKVATEPGYPNYLESSLVERGYDVVEAESLPDGIKIGVVQCIRFDGVFVYASSDPRKGGVAAGYNYP